MKRAILIIAIAALACHREDDAKTARQLTRGEPRRGGVAIQRYGCGACHEVQGVDGANGQVGPSLNGIGSRMYLAGRLPNTPDNMMRWVREPQTVANGTVMPNLNVTEADARDIAAYLYTLRQ